MADAAYYREWRAAHPEYAKRQNELRNARRKRNGRGDRSKEYAQRSRVRVDTTPLPPLYPELQHGKALSFWDDELRMDLAQERALAELEGRDPDEAVKVYAVREGSWHFRTMAIIEEVTS